MQTVKSIHEGCVNLHASLEAHLAAWRHARHAYMAAQADQNLLDRLEKSGQYYSNDMELANKQRSLRDKAKDAQYQKFHDKAYKAYDESVKKTVDNMNTATPVHQAAWATECLQAYKLKLTHSLVAQYKADTETKLHKATEKHEAFPHFIDYELTENGDLKKGLGEALAEEEHQRAALATFPETVIATDLFLDTRERVQVELASCLSMQAAHKFDNDKASKLDKHIIMLKGGLEHYDRLHVVKSLSESTKQAYDKVHLDDRQLISVHCRLYEIEHINFALSYSWGSECQAMISNDPIDFQGLDRDHQTTIVDKLAHAVLLGSWAASLYDLPQHILPRQSDCTFALRVTYL